LDLRESARVIVSDGAWRNGISRLHDVAHFQNLNIHGTEKHYRKRRRRAQGIHSGGISMLILIKQY
jgi:hypothetical protein